jgi:hypothetical protein
MLTAAAAATTTTTTIGKTTIQQYSSNSVSFTRRPEGIQRAGLLTIL